MGTDKISYLEMVSNVLDRLEYPSLIATGVYLGFYKRVV